MVMSLVQGRADNRPHISYVFLTSLIEGAFPEGQA